MNQKEWKPWLYLALPRVVLQDRDFRLSAACPQLWMPDWKGKTEGIYLKKKVTLCQWPGSVLESMRKKESVHWITGVLSHYKCRLDSSKVSLPLLWQTYPDFRVFSGLMGSHVQDLRLSGQVFQGWWLFIQNNPQGYHVPLPLFIVVVVCHCFRIFLSQYLLLLLNLLLLILLVYNTFCLVKMTLI